MYVNNSLSPKKIQPINANKQNFQAVVVKTLYSPVGNVALVIGVDMVDRLAKALILEDSNFGGGGGL